MTKILIDREVAQQALEALMGDPDAIVQIGALEWEYVSDRAITALKAALEQPEQPEPTDLCWAEAPKRTQWGAGMMEGMVALGKDHTLRLYAEREALPLVVPALRAALEQPEQATGKESLQVEQPEQEPVAFSVGRTLHWHEGKGVNDAQLYTAPPQRPAEPVQEPAAIVGTQEDVWKGQGGQWAPPGPPIKTVHMLRELPVGELLYTAPPQRKPLSEEEIMQCFDEAVADYVDVSDAEMVDFARAVERAHEIKK